MSHARTQIRTYVVNLLNTNGIVTYSSRKLPTDVLPATSVYTDREDLNIDESIGNYYHLRDLTLIVRSIVRGDSIDEIMDTLSSSIESIMLQDEFLSNQCYATDLISTDMGLDDSSEFEKGILTLTFSVKYLTEKGSPEIILR